MTNKPKHIETVEALGLVITGAESFISLYEDARDSIERLCDNILSLSERYSYEALEPVRDILADAQAIVMKLHNPEANGTSLDEYVTRLANHLLTYKSSLESTERDNESSVVQ